MTPISVRWSAILLSIAGLLTPSIDTPAQQPMVFVHGGLNDGSAWGATSNYLRTQFWIQPLLPTLGWTDPFADQETRLYNAIAPYRNIPALAHSNGGLAARQHVRARGTGSSINRLATIGTPHGGLMLATNALGGNIGAWAQSIIGAIGDPIYFYSNWDPDWWWAEPVGLEDAAYNMQRFGDFLPFAVANGLGVAAAYPVTFNLRPGDAFLADLNSAQEQSLEASVLNTRVGISTTTRPQNAMMRLLLSNWGTWTDIRWSLWAFAIAMRAYYSNHSDYYLRANAWRWDVLALRMMDLDVVWQWQIGALQSATCSPGWCFAIVYPSDGLVRLSSQTYPGGTRQRTVSGDIVHTQQKNASAARNVFVSVLREDFGVAPPPPSLAVSISGYSTVKTAGLYKWSTSASGGNGSYTYTWERREGSGSYYWVGSGTTYSEYIDGGSPASITLRVTAVSGNQSGQGTKTISNLIIQ